MPVGTASETGSGAGMEEAAFEDLSESGKGVEVGVVAAGIASEADIESVVEVVAPLCSEAVATALSRRDQPRVIQVGLGDQRRGPAKERAARQDIDVQLLEQVCGSGVAQRVHGVETQPVDVIFGEEHQGVVDDVAANLIGLLAVQVQLIPPEGGTSIVSQVRRELWQVVPAR